MENFLEPFSGNFLDDGCRWTASMVSGILVPRRGEPVGGEGRGERAANYPAEEAATGRAQNSVLYIADVKSAITSSLGFPSSFSGLLSLVRSVAKLAEAPTGLASRLSRWARACSSAVSRGLRNVDGDAISEPGFAALVVILSI